MSTELLYMNDSYLKEFEAKIIKIIDENKILLDKTAFYPVGGGLPSDTGVIIYRDFTTRVTNVFKDKTTGNVIHEVEMLGPLKENLNIIGRIDWDRRYKIMRMHTGLHALIGVLNKKTKALVTGNQIKPERSRVDVNIEKPDATLIKQIFDETNKLLKEGREVRIFYMEREKALEIPGLIKLAKALPPAVKILRIVEIVGVDIQPDGGPHVRNTREVGELVFLKLENKGKNNRRIHFTLSP